MPAAPDEDAALMAASQHIVTDNKKSQSDSTGNNSNSATNALARSNLLRLETSELLKESFLHIHPTGDASHAHYEAKWAPTVRSYLESVKNVVEGLGKATLGPDVAILPNSKSTKEKGMEHLHNPGSEKYRIPLLSDKFTKSTENKTAGINPLTSWQFPFAGGASLTIAPIGSFAHVGNAGLANRHANGNVVPVLDVAVLVNGSLIDGSCEEEAFVGGKDYLNGRYTDKRNILAVHIAKQLSQKKHRSKIGAVHLTQVFGDSRKVGLVLTPPLDNDNDSTADKKKRKRSKGEEKSKDKAKKNNKLRFRIRLIFGVKPEQGSNSTQHSDDESNSDSEEEMEEAASWNSWIPRARLLPNRSNHRIEKQSDDSSVSSNGTPHYTNSLAEDLHLVTTSNLVSATLSTLTPTSGSNNVSPTSSFHETLLLVKVWALQRGFLRGHDSFTTTTLAVLLVYLYRTKGIGKRMGAVQGFIAFMKFWSENDWLGEDALDSSGDVKENKIKKKVAFVIPVEGRNEAQTVAKCAQSRLYLDDVRGNPDDGNTRKTLLDCFKASYTSSASHSSSIANTEHHDSPILLDPTMTLNYLARLSPSFVRESRGEAYAALRCIHGQEQEGGTGAFKKLFLETNRFWTRYDAYVRVPLAAVPKLLAATASASGAGGGKKKHGKATGSGSNASNVWGHDVNDLGYDESVCRSVVEVLSRALGDRATAIRAFTGGNGDIRNAVSNEMNNEDAATKVIVDSDQCHTVPIRGSGSTQFGYAARLAERSSTPSALYSQNDKEQEPHLVIGLRINPTTSRRIVDRGPPAEDIVGSNAFVALWGEKAAQLRRFQDGAIVRAVVWNAAGDVSGGTDVQFHGMDRSMGGIAERIVQHIVKLHFTDSKLGKKRKDVPGVAFELRNMLSFIDGVSVAPASSPQSSRFADSLALHKNAMTAFDSLAEFLRRNTKTTNNSLGKGKQASSLGLPLSVDEVEPLSPCLRYSALFPPVPHPLLGGTDVGSSSDKKRKVSGVNVGSPILIQIRFEGSSKWPTSLNAMGAAKCAMLAQLADGIDKMKQEHAGGASGSVDNNADLDGFDGPMDVTPNYLDIGYRGYSWRIIVRADQELRMLRSLGNPTVEAKTLQLSLIHRHVRGAMHHSLIHAVHTRHPSASSVVRLVHRWVASHMLSDMIPQDAVELMVAKIYTAAEEEEEKSSNSKKIGSVVDMPPSTVVAGFLKFLQLLSTHDWVREPLIVDPQNHISSHDRGLIHTQFNNLRGPELRNGPAMYIISPADYDGVEAMVGSKVVGENNESIQQMPADADEKIWAPTVTAKFPEKVVLSRAAALAKCSHDHLTSCIRSDGKIGNNGWVAAFQESSASLTSYSALLRVDPSYVTNAGCSSTNADCTITGATPNQDTKEQPGGPFEKSLEKRFAGPKELRKKHYKNLVLEKDTLHEWQPVNTLVKALRSKYSNYALFFYNEFAPDVIAMIWRPDAFKPQPFSAIVSEFKRPATEFWKEDSLVITNTEDLMAEIGYFSRNIVSNFKVFDDKKPEDAPLEKSPKKSRQEADDDGESSDDSEEE
mmetsp:Transcript_1191/g.2196  ORF Transcript_1191/g.2196 Transcript_1191/m.2196 type:complete len:1553 (-) Transcript_1191:57-4715(-)